MQARLIAQSIGHAFQVAYMEFLKANGIEEPNDIRQLDYQDVLNQQEINIKELGLFASKETQKEVGKKFMFISGDKFKKHLHVMNN